MKFFTKLSFTILCACVCARVCMCVFRHVDYFLGLRAVSTFGRAFSSWSVTTCWVPLELCLSVSGRAVSAVAAPHRSHCAKAAVGVTETRARPHPDKALFKITGAQPTGSRKSPHQRSPTEAVCLPLCSGEHHLFRSSLRWWVSGAARLLAPVQEGSFLTQSSQQRLFPADAWFRLRPVLPWPWPGGLETTRTVVPATASCRSPGVCF